MLLSLISGNIQWFALTKKHLMFRFFVGFVLLSAIAIAGEPPALRDQVSALFREQKWTEAQTLLQQAVAANPNDAEANFFLGVSFINQKDAEHAVPSLEKAVALAPTNGNYARTLGDAYGMTAQKAGLFAKLGWAKKCKAAYDKAVELDPNDLNARWCMMEFSRQAPSFLGGGMEGAYMQAAEIKKLDPARGRAAYTTLYLSEKKYAEAFALYDELLKDSPNDLGTLYQIGKLADTTGQQLDRGLTVLEKCLTIPQPVDARGLAPIHWRIGNILLKKSDPTRARAAYQAALVADPKFTPASEALAKLP